MKTNRQVSVSQDTIRVIEVRAQFAAVYNDLVEALSHIDASQKDEDAENLKEAMLDADAEMMHYIAKLIDVHLVESNYSQL